MTAAGMSGVHGDCEVHDRNGDVWRYGIGQDMAIDQAEQWCEQFPDDAPFSVVAKRGGLIWHQSFTSPPKPAPKMATLLAGVLPLERSEATR